MKTFNDVMNQTAILKADFAIKKAVEDKRLAFGWASVANFEDGSVVVDSDDDVIDIGTLEKAAYKYVRLYRSGGEMHERGAVAELVESIVFTKEKAQALGIPDGIIPEGWWVGFFVTDEVVWEKVKSGEYAMFSIGGKAQRVEVEE
ncbi:MAG: hypothetical protein IJ741_03630 [Schwartzia sp.]|nr:hypothetical protein [Schwartzia sp. (in: firmicutes)]